MTFQGSSLIQFLSNSLFSFHHFRKTKHKRWWIVICEEHERADYHTFMLINIITGFEVIVRGTQYHVLLDISESLCLKNINRPNNIQPWEPFGLGLFLIDRTGVGNLLTYQISCLKNIDRPNNKSCYEWAFWTRFVSYRRDQSGKFANISYFNFWSSCIMSYFARSPFKFSR